MRLRREHIAIIAAGLIGAGAGAFLLFAARPNRAPVPTQAPVAAQHQPSVPAAVALPRLERIDCWFAMPPGRSARCGSLLVAEQPGSAAGRALRLRFVVFPGKAEVQAADPVIYISGGPGEPAQIDAATIGRWWSWIARAPWLAEREVIVFDQRGVGVSEPPMTCPEIADAGYRIFPQALAEADEARLWGEAARRCHDRLAASGLDLAQYNTEAIVADLHALIGELGLRRWTLFAVSYGTRVALQFLRGNAEGTRGVVLDSTYPPEALSYVDGPRNGARAFDELFKECAADAHCDAAFPHLAESFERVVRRAIAAPLAVTLADPRSGQPVPVKLDAARLVETLFYGLYEWRATQQMPALIAALDRGDAQPLLPLATAAFATYASAKESHGLYLSVECHDEFPFNDRAAVAKAAAEMPLFKDFALTTLPLMACPAWPVGSAAAAEREPVASDVPILLLAGELDPAASPDWAKEAVQRLPRARLIRFRGIGHGVVAAHACADLLVARFLADPLKQPYDDCLLAIGTPQFTRATLGP